MAGVRNEPHKNTGRYQGYYKDYTGKRKFFWGFKSKSKTRRRAEQLGEEHRQIRLGYKPIPTLSDKRQKRSFREVADEYLEWGNTQGGLRGKPWGKTHAKERMNKLTWWEKELKLSTVSDLSGSLSRIERVLRKLMKTGYDGKGKGVSGKTVSNYVDTLRSFCNWSIKRDYLEEDPLKDLALFDTTQQTHRRALTSDEIHRLLKVAPEHRRVLYEVALTTGLRAGELRALTLKSVDVNQAAIILDSAWTKNRKPGRQLIPRWLVRKLVEFGMKGIAQSLYRKRYKRKDSEPEGIPTSPLLYVSTHTSREFKKDLQSAGVKEYIPEQGKLDFHSCRVTFITLAIEAGANAKEGQTLARHSTPQLTMDLYARTRDDRLSDLVEKVGEIVIRNENVPYMCHTS